MNQLQALYEIQDGRCWICGKEIDLSLDRRSHPMAASQDHFIPKSRGGCGLHGNKLLAHRICNSKRGDKVPAASIRSALAAIYCTPDSV